MSGTKPGIGAEREGIIDENAKLKVIMQKLKSEVAFHRAEFLKIESELKHKEKLIDDLLQINRKDSGSGLNMSINYTSSPNSNNSISKVKEYNLILSLKKNLKDFQAQSKLKEEELVKIKKQIKLTKMNELLVENKTINEELKKIKDLYDTNLMNNFLSEKNSKEFQLLQSTIARQQSLVESLQEHNNKLLDENKKQAEKITLYKDKCNKLREEMKEKISELDGLKKTLENFEKLEKESKYEELHKLVQERETKIQKKKEKSQTLKKELKERLTYIDELKKQVEDVAKMTTVIEESKLKISRKKERSSKLKQEFKIKQEELLKIQNEFNEMNRVSVDLNKDDEEAKEFLVGYLQSRVTELTKESSYYKILSQKREKLLNEVKSSLPNLSHADLLAYIKDKDIIVELQTRLELLNMQIEEKEKEIQGLKDKIVQMENNIDVNVNIMPTEDINNQNGGEDTMTNQLSEEQFNEMTYILIKNFEAKNIDIKIAQGQMFNDEILSDAANLTEKIADKIIGVLKNSNQANKEELVKYLKYFFAHYGINLETIRDQFISVFENISTYPKETCDEMDQILRNFLMPHKEELTNLLRDRDPDGTGFITFFHLRRILQTLEILLEAELVEYFIYRLKCFDDAHASFRDLKYEYIAELLNVEKQIVEVVRRQSNTSSVVMLPDKEYKAKSEALLAKIAAFLFSYEKSIKGVFHQSFIIQEKECSYNAMYLKLFLNVLEEEMKIPVDYVDSLCVFNRLKNPHNIFNIEVIDVDKLSEEMVHYGISENEDNNTQRKEEIFEIENNDGEIIESGNNDAENIESGNIERENIENENIEKENIETENNEREYEFDYDAEEMAKANANILTDEVFAKAKQPEDTNEEAIGTSENKILNYIENFVEENKKEEAVFHKQLSKIAKASKKTSKVNTPKNEEAEIINEEKIIENPQKDQIIIENPLNEETDKNLICLQVNENDNISDIPKAEADKIEILKEDIDSVNMGEVTNQEEDRKDLETIKDKEMKIIENGDNNNCLKRVEPNADIENGVNINRGSVQNPNGVTILNENTNVFQSTHSEDEPDDLNKISLLYEVKQYLRSYGLEFEKVFSAPDLLVFKKGEETCARFLPLLHFLNSLGVVANWDFEPNSIGDVLDSEGCIVMSKFKEAVQCLKVSKEQEIEFSKRYSKELIDGLFSNAINCKK
jgi:hypothetical protein